MRRTAICSATFVLLALAVPFNWFDVKFTYALIVIYLVFYLIPLLLVLLVEIRTSIGRQAHLGLGVTHLALGIASFGVGFALAHRYPDAMSAQRNFTLLLMFSAVPLVPWGIFFTLVPWRRRLAIVVCSVAFVLISPTISLLMARFAFR